MVNLDMIPIATPSTVDFGSTGAPVLLVPRTTLYGRWFKRPIDIVLALVIGALLAPLMVLIALSIPVMLGRGGVIYRQERIGRDGQVFTIYKFRSMLRDRRERANLDYAGPERRQNHKSIDDPRHRPYGRFLRATSLDELPQLLNVLKGQMSMVGPRPELIAVAIREGFASHPRNMTRPGLTGAFQVSPLRTASRISAGLHLDIDYVVDVRFGDDLKILARTLLIPFQRRGR
ncbi:MAG: sugar transferase [Acidimicrobiales bacterium]